MQSASWGRFRQICVLSALVTVGTTQPTYNSPPVEQTEHHTPPEHHMSQPQHHIMSQPEPHIRQPYHFISQIKHGYDSWSTAQARAQTQSQPTWISPDQPVETLSQPHIINAQPHTIHSQPQPIDPQFELHPYPYQHPHYPPTGSHHAQDTVYPTHGWTSQNPAVIYQDPLPEAPAPEHHLNSYKKDYPDQSSAVASAVPSYSSNSVPISHEPANPQVYKIISIPKADDAADYIMPVADHETRQPRVVHTSNNEDLPDIVQDILARYRHIPIEIKPEPKPDNNAASLGPVNRPHTHKTHKVTTIPGVTKLTAKAVAAAKTGNDKTCTINGGKHSTATKAPLKRKHKHSHKKVLKPLLDPELLAKVLNHLSKELRVLLPDKTHEKDMPCDDNPIVTDDRTNCNDADGDNLSDSPDKNKPMNKNHNKNHSHKSADTTPKKGISEKTRTPSEPYDKKDARKDIDYDSASLDETTKPCEDDYTTNSKPLDPKIETNDFKETKVVKKEEVKKELIKTAETKKEEKREPSETKKYDGKQNQKKHTDKDNDRILANPDEITEPCDDNNALEKEKKHVLNNKADDKHTNDPEKKNTNPKPVDPKTEKNYLKEKEVVQKKDAKKETTQKAETKKKEKIEQSPKYVSETKIYDGKQNLKEDQKDNDRISAYSDKTTEPCDTYNAPEKEDNTKNLQLNTDDQYYIDKPVDKGNEDTITDHKVVEIKKVKEEVSRKVATEKEKVEQQLKKTKQQPEIYDAKQKDARKDIDYDSASLDETTKPCEDDYTTNSKPLDPKIETNDFKETKVVKKEEVKKELIKTAETKKEEKREPSETKKYDGKQNQKKHTDKDNDRILANPDEITEPCDDNNALEKEKKHVPNNKADDKQTNDPAKKNTNPKPVDPKTENNDLKEKEVVQKKDAKKETTQKAETKKKEKIEQSPKYVSETKIYDGKQNLKEDQKDNDRISAYSDETTEPCDTYNAPEKEDNTKNLQLNRLDDQYYIDKPVDKGNEDTITDHKVVEIKKVKEEVSRKVATEKEKVEQQLKKTKQQPETYDAKQKPVEHDTPVSDEDSLIQVPYDKISAPEHRKEMKKPLPKDNYKRVSPDTDKEKKDIIIAKQDEKKVEQLKEMTGKVETKKEDKQTLKNVPEPKKYEEKLKPEKQENNFSDIEDCDSTESNEPQRQLDKTPSPEYERESKEIKEPLAKVNKDKSVVVDKSKSVETSTENSDIDDGDSAESETHPKLDIINTEMQDARNKKAEEVNKERVTIANNKAEGNPTGEDLTSDEVAEILEKTETDQPLSTIGFLFSLISHALQGSDSVRQMFEEPKVKSFIKSIIPLFHEKQKEGISDYA